jgi:hypothetical protein
MLLLCTGRLKTLWYSTRITFFEQETYHVTLDQFQVPWITRAETILVNDHRQTLQPLIPALLRYVLKNSLAQLAGVRWALETLGLAIQNDTVNHSGHAGFLGIKFHLSPGYKFA